MTRRYKRHVVRADKKDLNNSAHNQHVEHYDPNKRLMYGGQLFHQVFPEIFKCIRRTLPYPDIKHIAESPYHCTNMFLEFVEHPEKFGADLSPVKETKLWVEIDELIGASIPGTKKWRTRIYPEGYGSLRQAICRYLNIPDNEFDVRVRNIVRIKAQLSIGWFADTYPNVYSIEGCQSDVSPYGNALKAFLEDWGGTREELRQPCRHVNANPISYHKEMQDLEACRDWGHY